MGWTLALLPFATVSVIHLVSKLTEAAGWDRGTKPLLMPTLALAFVLLGRRLGRLGQILLLAGLLASWIGDLTIANLPVGLGFFLVAHACYIALFLIAFDRRASWWGLAAVPWFGMLLLGLGGKLGSYFAPLALYGIVLGVMAVCATRGTPLTALGGVLFVASDSMLAFRLFTEHLQGPVADFAIMLLYVAAQAALVIGVLRSRPPGASRRASRGSASRGSGHGAARG